MTPAAETRLTRCIIFGLIALWATLRYLCIGRSHYELDELQHLHIAFNISKGLLPYRDFFDHHGLAYHYLIAPFISWMRPDASFDAAVQTISNIRYLSWLLGLLILWQVYALGRMWRGPAVGIMAALLVSTCSVFSRVAIQIRPDLLALSLLLWSIILLFKSLTRLSLFQFLLSALLLGTALMCTQKIVYAFPAYAGCLLWFLVSRRSDGVALGTRLLMCIAFAAAVSLPFLFMASWFAYQGALQEFIECFIKINLNWPAHKSFANEELRYNAMFSLVALVGVGIVMREKANRVSSSTIVDIGLWMFLLSMLAGMYLIPELTPQYVFMVAPFVLLYTAVAVEWVRSSLLSGAGDSFNTQRLCLSATLLCIICVPCFFYLWATYNKTNTSRLSVIREVMENTKPDDRVLDGFSGVAVFRPHSCYFFYIHNGTARMIKGRHLENMLACLSDPRTAPRLVIEDQFIERLRRPILELLKVHYDLDPHKSRKVGSKSPMIVLRWRKDSPPVPPSEALP